MPLSDRATLYAALQSKDARFDGRFFVGVSSTGIYCRPICRAKVPKPENCMYYATAAEAETAGYRPCLLCRPELAPGLAMADSAASLVRRAARMFEENCADALTVEQIAARLGYTGRHLRRIFEAELHVTPVQYLQTCRLLLAKNLLTGTRLPITEVALASGFGSVRRFNDLFQKRYRLSPSRFRRHVSANNERRYGIAVELGYRPPYRWQEMLDFLARRAIPGVETVQDGEYLRTVKIGNTSGSITVSNNPVRNTLAVSVSESLLPVLPQVLTRVRGLFDVTCDPEAVFEALRPMNDIMPGLCAIGTRLPGCFDSFEMSVRAILGQQITIKAAQTLAGRLAEKLGTPLDTGIPGLTHTFPAAETFVKLDEGVPDTLWSLGVTRTRARSILALAAALEGGALTLTNPADPADEIKKLIALPGIGDWTAQYIAMRAMGWTDAFAHTDYGVKKALEPRSAKEILRMAQAWRPWRAYATINLWKTRKGETL